MCTLIVLQQVHPDFPVVVAANRDEFLAREATAPQLLLESPPVVGGRDLERGGTWMGVTAGGLFAGVTNQRTYFPPDQALRSRGGVVLDALARGSRDGIDALLSDLRPRDYNAFNLLYGDARGLRAAYARPSAGRVEIEDVPNGIHVLPNDRLDSPAFPKAGRARALASAAAGEPWPVLAEALRAVLADHERPSLGEVEEPPPGSPFTRDFARELHAVCIHTPAYGTRSSSIVALVPGGAAHYLFADGPPCETAHLDYTAMLR